MPGVSRLLSSKAGTCGEIHSNSSTLAPGDQELYKVVQRQESGAHISRRSSCSRVVSISEADMAGSYCTRSGGAREHLGSKELPLNWELQFVQWPPADWLERLIDSRVTAYEGENVKLYKHG